MAKQPGSPTGGSDDSASESRPISVSELLARRDAAIADEERAKRLTESRGRRRAGRDGAVSVSELTGEIPRITDAPRSEAPKTSAPKTQAPKTQAPKADTPAAGAPNAWKSPDSAPHFPRSSSPVPRRATDRRPLQDSADPAGASTGFDRGVYDAPPQTRDFSSAAIAERASRSTSDGEPVSDEHANAVTGIIPIVGDDDTADGVRLVEADDVDVVELDAPPPARTGRFADVIDDDFDAYRSFAEYDEDDEKSASSKKRSARRSGDKPKRKRGWFGRKAAARDDRTDVESDSLIDDDRHTSGAAFVEETTAIGIVEESRDVTPDAERSGDVERPSDASAYDDGGKFDADKFDGDRAYGYSSFDSVREDDDERDAREHADRDAAEALESDSPEAATTGLTGVGAAAVAPAVSTSPADKSPADENPVDASAADKSAADEKETDSPAALLTPTSEAPKSKTLTSKAATSKDARPGDSDDGDGRSPAKAWLLVIGEAILGLAVGVGLFWGFTELWRWNVYFALVLAVLVIFGIVSFTHAVRHSRDLFTTLLALGVGLIVTIGPLVLLAT
ncbi:transmembrane protein [Mycobacteroides abscessus subsp. abscessus]|nr:transmembrane protein [Mycobacteroides abscessus subsp. abscessus]